MMRNETVTLFLWIFIASILNSCANPGDNGNLHNGQVVVIFEDCPIQTSTEKLGGSVSQVDYSTVAFVDEDACLVEYEPSLFGRDTLIIPTFQGYAEMMHLYQAIEYDYFLLEEGDTVLVKYTESNRPVLKSLTSDKNTKLYNIPYLMSGAVQHKGYYIETVMSNFYFVKAFDYFTNKAKYSDLNIDDFLNPLYVNLDSLFVEYEIFKKSLKNTLDSLFNHQIIDDGRHSYYIHRFLDDYRYKTSEIVQSDSLLHYISNYITAQDYCSGRNSLEAFDILVNDSTVTTLAKNVILKHLVNNIIDGEGGWHIYPNSIVTEYIQKYKSITGDMQPEQVVKQKDIIVDSSNYALPLEAVDGGITNLNEILKLCKGNLVYVDLWASWCAPCLAQIPFSKALHEHLSDYDIKFIFISVDTSHKNWELKVKENPYLLHNSYRITDSDADFLKEIRLSKIPRYLIFDRQGKLVDSDAIRPSDKNIESQLISLLNETDVTK